MKITLKAILLVILIGLLPATSSAAQIEEKPGPFTMVGDLLVARPIGFVLVALGTLAFIVTLPFSLAGGNMTDVADVLVIKPAMEVFVRCLGCRRIGRKEKIRD